MQGKDPSIFDEPHMRGGGWKRDPSEDVASRNVEEARQTENIDDAIHHSVWVEPGRSAELTGAIPDDALTYAKWYEFRGRQIGLLDSWAMAFCWAMVAGPLAIVGVLFGSLSTSSLFIAAQAILIGPVAEEVMKVVIPLWVIERRPYFLKSRLQIYFCAIAGGFVFAAVENFMYLTVNVFDWSNPLTRWRWTVCVALHTFCCIISAMGLSRIWKTTDTELSPPNIQLGVPYLTTAIALHGTYNAFALTFEWLLEPF